MIIRSTFSRSPALRQLGVRFAGFKAAMKAGLAGLGAASAVALAAAVTPAAAGQVTPLDIGVRDTTALLFSGAVQAGDLARLQAETAKVPAGQRIVLMLESGGGLISEGLAIGRFVASSKITTTVVAGPGCHSACTLIFLAGRDASAKPMRIMMAGARIGFHQASSGQLRPDQTVTAAEAAAAQTGVQNAIAAIDAYFRELGIQSEFLTLTLSAPNSTVNLLRELDALRLGIFVMDPSTQKLLTPDGFKQQLTSR